MSANVFSWLGNICSICWAGVGLLLPQDHKDWVKVLSAMNEDWSNKIKNLQNTSVRAIFKKLGLKCVKYKLKEHKRSSNNLLELNYWGKKEGEKECKWKEEIKVKESLKEEELRSIEEICEDPLWESVSGNNNFQNYLGKRLVNYNWCLNFAIKKIQEETKE